MKQSGATTTRRRVVQVRLGAAFGLLTICALAFAAWGNWRRALEEERRALAAIRDTAEGFVYFEEEWDTAAERPLTVRSGPRRAMRDYLLARNALDRVVAVSFDCAFEVQDMWGKIPLELVLIPDQSVDALSGLPNLQWLDFRYTNVTDDQLARLPPIPSLHTLRLQQCSQVSEVGLASLSRLPALRNLNLQAIGMDDGDLAALAEISSLERLDISSNGITDAGLPDLYPLTKLRHLDLTGTDVTRIGVYRLRQQLPNAEISATYTDQ